MTKLAMRLKADPCPVCGFEVRMPVFNEATDCLEVRCLLCGSMLLVPAEVAEIYKSAL